MAGHATGGAVQGLRHGQAKDEIWLGGQALGGGHLADALIQRQQHLARIVHLPHLEWDTARAGVGLRFALVGCAGPDTVRSCL